VRHHDDQSQQGAGGAEHGRRNGANRDVLDVRAGPRGFEVPQRQTDAGERQDGKEHAEAALERPGNHTRGRWPSKRSGRVIFMSRLVLNRPLL